MIGPTHRRSGTDHLTGDAAATPDVPVSAPPPAETAWLLPPPEGSRYHGAGYRDRARHGGVGQTEQATEPGAGPPGWAGAEHLSEARVPPLFGQANTRPPAGAGAEHRAAADGAPAPAAAALLGPGRGSERARIGDQLRIPTAWCELSPCISRHADRDALGEADIRARAIAAGWCIDALGRLACPACQQRDTRFRGTRPVVLWNRAAALTRAALIAAALQDRADQVAAIREETTVIPALPREVMAPPAAPVPPALAPSHTHRGRGRHRRED